MAAHSTVARRHTANNTANSISNRTTVRKLDLEGSLAMAVLPPAMAAKAHHQDLLEATVSKLVMAVLPATAVHPAVTMEALLTTITTNITNTAVLHPTRTNTQVVRRLANILLHQDSTRVATAAHLAHLALTPRSLAGNRPPAQVRVP